MKLLLDAKADTRKKTRVRLLLLLLLFSVVVLFGDDVVLRDVISVPRLLWKLLWIDDILQYQQ